MQEGDGSLESAKVISSTHLQRFPDSTPGALMWDSVSILALPGCTSRKTCPRQRSQRTSSSGYAAAAYREIHSSDCDHRACVRGVQCIRAEAFSVGCSAGTI